MKRTALISIIVLLMLFTYAMSYAYPGYDQDRISRIQEKVNENIPGTMASSAEEAAGSKGEVSETAAGGTLYVEVDIDFPWRNLKSALVQTAKYLTAQAKGEPDGTGGVLEAQTGTRKVSVYNGMPSNTGGTDDNIRDESSGENHGNEVGDEESSTGGAGGPYVSWVDSMMDTSKYFTAQTVFGGDANENDFYRISGQTGRGGGDQPDNTGGVLEYDPGTGYGEDDLIYYPGSMFDLPDSSGIDFTGMSSDYIWHMSLSDIREGVDLGFIVETGDPSMPFAWKKAETNWNGDVVFQYYPVIELTGGSVKNFPDREYFGFGTKKTEHEIRNIQDDIDEMVGRGEAVKDISAVDLYDGLRTGTIKYVGDSNTGCLYLNTASGECVVSSREMGTLGVIKIANEALLGIVENLYRPTAATESVMDSGYEITRNVSVALVPLVIILTIASAMRAGASSVSGIAEARSSVINLLICIGLAFSSRWLLSRVSDISYAIATEIGRGAILFNDSMLTSLTFGSTILIMLFTFIFIFIIIALLIEFYLAAMSLQVMYALLAALGPLFIILSAFKPLEWLRGQWLKMLLQAVVLAPANALIINLLNHISWNGGASGVLLASAMYIGCASILIAINSSVAKRVLSSAAMVASKSADFIKGGFTGAGGLNLAGFAASGGFEALGTALSRGENISGASANTSTASGMQISGNGVSANSRTVPVPGTTGNASTMNGKPSGGSPVPVQGRNSGQQNLFSTLLSGTKLGGGVAAANRLKDFNIKSGYVKSTVYGEISQETLQEKSFFRKYNNSVDVSDVKAIEQRIRSMDTEQKLTETEVHNAADSASKMISVAYQGAKNAGLDPMNGYQGDSMEQGASNILDFGIARGVQMHAEYNGHAKEFLDAIPAGQRPGIDAFRRNEGASYYEQGILIAGEFMENHASDERNFGEAAAEVTDRLEQADLMRNIRW